MEKDKKILVGTFRIGKDLKVYKKTNDKWKKYNKEFPFAFEIIKLFKKNGRFSELIDKNNSKFLKGEFYKGQIKGARINILPDGQILSGAYSLFAEHLILHDQKVRIIGM